MIYIARDDGALPLIFVKAKNKKEAKEIAYGYYKTMAKDVLKKDIFIYKPLDFFRDPEIKLVDLGGIAN